MVTTCALDYVTWANHYAPGEYDVNGVPIPVVPSPVQFDGQPWQPTRAPEHGEHTETVLLDFDEIAAVSYSGHNGMAFGAVVGLIGDILMVEALNDLDTLQ